MILKGDCIQVMKAIKPNSIDAIVTDPPYNLHFMGKDWDKDLLHEQWLSEAFKVMKPGASMLVMGGTRTFHRLACAIEDTGFIIKDTLMWIYGSGFPKAQDLGKMIDKRNGAERRVVGENINIVNRPSKNGKGFRGEQNATITTPSTPLAKHWDGFKIGGIKPAYEPIIWAVKPPEGSYIDNVLKWGVGAVNVDETRIDTQPRATHGNKNIRTKGFEYDRGRISIHEGEYAVAKGRFPANIILDEEAGKVMDEMSGQSDKSIRKESIRLKSYNSFAEKVGASSGFKPGAVRRRCNDSGGASRFFYCAKASRSERGEDNNHPTVKPISLMSWLIKLVTREGQIVLDPFLGSGTTGISAIKSNRKFIGIEREEEYIKIAQERIKHCESQARQMELGNPS